MRIFGIVIASIFTLLMVSAAEAADKATPKPIYNSQAPGEHPSSPAAAIQEMTVPAGFQVTLFAGEPDVSQPVSMAFDRRGRVWVAEFYTYAGRGFDGELSDRIVILADNNHDGRHDERKVFWSSGNRLSSVLPGHQGCWILNAGALAWLADKNEDDQADGPPIVVLDGFDQDQVGHNIVNGLMYGPDGWIYGRHGIQATSSVGPPDSAPQQRIPINCAIWRYHPQQKRFEPVTAGTTNPWGLDYNEFGDFFFTNNVIGHGWYVIPGAHYKRMYGADFNPHFYELIDQHADHYHWDHSASWTDSREDNGIHGKLGGGHSHCGGMIYLGDNWPDRYRSQLYMCNTHGRRVNQDLLKRHGSGYVLEHGEDMIFANQPWFRGVGLMYGPDGGVYLSDWTDLGECHDNDGVHRLSGRIYKITYGQPQRAESVDLSKQTLTELVSWHQHKNEWFVRQARQELIDRQLAGIIIDPAIEELNSLAESAEILTDKLRCLWTLFSLHELAEPKIQQLLTSDSEVLRSWGIRFLCDGMAVSEKNADQMIQIARQEPSAYVRLTLCSALQKMPGGQVWELAAILCRNSEDQNDHNIPLMIWYGIEPHVKQNPQQAIALLKSSQLPLIRQFLARRLMHENESQPAIRELLSELLLQTQAQGLLSDLLTGMTAATQGWRKATPLPAWEQISQSLLLHDSETIRSAARELSVVFGDGRAMEELWTIVKDESATPIDRVNALEILITSRPDGIVKQLQTLLTNRVLETTVAAGLASFDDAQTPQILLNRYRWLKGKAQENAIQTLCSRASYAAALLTAMEKRPELELQLSAAQARQIVSFESPELTAQLEKVWGVLQTNDAEKQAQIEHWKNELTPDLLANANLPAGRKLYDQTCAACHRLFDAGQEIGPTLTGANRDNLDYLLENMIAPSAVVPKQYQISTVLLASGRVLNGIVVSQTERTLVLQTEKEKLTIDQEEVELIKPSQLSLMPAGQIDKLSVEQVRDLIGYLQSPRQVLAVQE